MNFFVLASLLSSLLTFTSVFAQETRPGVKHQSEAGLVSVSGNSRARTISAAQKTSYAWTMDTLNSTARYVRTTSQGVESVKNWLTSLGYERKIFSDFSFMFNQTVEGNRFSGFLQRYASDIGGKKIWVNNSSFSFFNELGYRYQKQNNTNGTVIRSSYGRVYLDATKPLTPTFKLNAWLEYLPNFSQKTDWQLNSEVSGVATINSVFSIKTAYLIRFDNLPSPGIQYKTDRTFTTSLVASL